MANTDVAGRSGAFATLSRLVRGRDERGTGSRHHGRSRHRDTSSNASRAAVLGAGDGLLTNISLVLGVAGASTNASTVRLAGVAGLLAGAFSMAAGELVSVRAQDEMRRRELAVESAELTADPEAERDELEAMYQARGLSSSDASTVARILSANHAVALDTHARLELGIDPDAPGSALISAVASLVSFAVGALLPLLPWLFTGGSGAVMASVIIGGVAAIALGAAVAITTGRSIVATALRQLIITAVAAAVTFGVGSALGVATS